MTDLITIQKEVTSQLSNRETMIALMQTTFKGLSEENAKKAILEGMIRGYKFEDFLKKHVYAIAYGSTYSLVGSIDHARKIGMSNGVCGCSRPLYETDGDDETCTITIKRNVDGVIGEYSATVYFKEYSTGRNLWQSKPKTMIAKVAEMHALRKACPEQLAKMYVEEEMGEKAPVEAPKATLPALSDDIVKQVENIKNMDDLKTFYKANEGLGKEFGRLVVKQKEFLMSVTKDEHATA